MRWARRQRWLVASPGYPTGHRAGGSPGFLIERDAGEVFTVGFDFGDGVIAKIYLVINPDKLWHLHPARLQNMSTNVS
jgi:hypothetical protein